MDYTQNNPIKKPLQGHTEQSIEETNHIAAEIEGFESKIWRAYRRGFNRRKPQYYSEETIAQGT